jgi:hypothetical protein
MVPGSTDTSCYSIKVVSHRDTEDKNQSNVYGPFLETLKMNPKGSNKNHDRMFEGHQTKSQNVA